MKLVNFENDIKIHDHEDGYSFVIDETADVEFARYIRTEDEDVIIAFVKGMTSIEVDNIKPQGYGDPQLRDYLPALGFFKYWAAKNWIFFTLTEEQFDNAVIKPYAHAKKKEAVAPARTSAVPSRKTAMESIAGSVDLKKDIDDIKSMLSEISKSLKVNNELLARFMESQSNPFDMDDE